MASLDPRLAAALNDETAAYSMLNELHRQILACRDPNVLSSLLGRYVAIAAARYSLSSELAPRATRSSFPMGATRTAPMQDAKRHAIIVKIMRAAQDAQNNTIKNVR